MCILFLTQVLPYPLDAGPKIRAYFVLRRLAQAHNVTLVSFVRASDKPESIAHLEQYCDAVHTVQLQRSRLRDMRHLGTSFLTNHPFIIARDWSSSMAACLSSVIEASDIPFDVIHADQLGMAQYALLAKKFQSKAHPLKTVLDQHNAVFLIPQRLADGEANPFKRVVLRQETRKLAAYETQVCGKFDQVVWVSEEDRAAVSRISDEATASVIQASPAIPICIECDDIPPITPVASPFRVTFLGGLHWPPNAAGMQWLVNKVWPEVVAEHPQARLTVIGKDPPASLVAAATRLPGIEITGYVNDPTPLLQETAAFIVPLHAGGGMRVKILDAWRWGLPVVSTSIGAEGIEVAHGENILLANEAETFTTAVLHCLHDQELARRLRTRGRQTVARCYNWRRVYQRWDDIYVSEA